MSKNITINWKEKNGCRGLTEVAVETLRKLGVKQDNSQHITNAEELEKLYEKRKWDKDFNFAREVEIVSEYVDVLY